jgi:hypothetical protein
MSAKGFVLVQDGHYANVVAPVSAGAAQVGVRFNLATWAHASLIVRFGVAGGPAGAVTLKVYPAVTGGSGVAIPFKYAVQNAAAVQQDVFGALTQATATGYTPGTDIVDEVIAIELDAADLLVAANGTYVELNIAAGSLGTTAQLMSAEAILSGGRFAGDQSASVQV